LHPWRPRFAFPENSPPGFEEACYTLGYGNTRIIGLDSTRDNLDGQPNELIEGDRLVQERVGAGP